MTFTTAALIGGGASLLGGLLSAGAAGDAADAQSQAAQNATNAQLKIFNTQNQQQQPYRQAGYATLDQLLRGFGLGGASGGPTGGVGALTAPTRDQFTKTISNPVPASPGMLAGYGANSYPYGSRGTAGGSTSTFDQAGYDSALNAYNTQQAGADGGSGGAIPDGYFAHQFNADDLNSNLAPNYQFQLDQGLGAVKNLSNLQTGALSGNTLKGINDYAQNYAGNAYQQAYNNYTSNQSNIFNRLSTIAGLGSTANQQSAGLAGAISPGLSSSIQNVGNAQASGAVGQANAINGAANNALGWYTLSQLNNKGGNV